MKERILEAAYAILAAEGHAALTTRRVCEAVGVTMPTLYHHYANRDELVKAVYGLALERFMAKKRSLALTDDPMLDLRKGCELVLDFTSQNKNVTAAVMNRALDHPSILVPGYELLRERVHRAAEAHRLSVSEREATAMSGRGCRASSSPPSPRRSPPATWRRFGGSYWTRFWVRYSHAIHARACCGIQSTQPVTVCCDRHLLVSRDGFDDDSWTEDVRAVRETCVRLGLPAYIERSRSGSGGHVWLFFERPVAAVDARKLGCRVLTEGQEPPRLLLCERFRRAR